MPTTNYCYKKIAQGISCNSTLKHLEFDCYNRDNTTKVGPIFEALLSEKCGIETLHFYGDVFREGCAEVISSVISNAACPLKTLRIMSNDLQDDEFLQVLFSGAQSISPQIANGCRY